LLVSISGGTYDGSTLAQAMSSSAMHDLPGTLLPG
jgi:hypothetical protein